MPRLARLGIEWLVLVPGSEFPTEILNRQIDLVARPVDTDLAVYQNLSYRPADLAPAWDGVGAGAHAPAGVGGLARRARRGRLLGTQPGPASSDRGAGPEPVDRAGERRMSERVARWGIVLVVVRRTAFRLLASRPARRRSSIQLTIPGDPPLCDLCRGSGRVGIRIDGGCGDRLIRQRDAQRGGGRQPGRRLRTEGDESFRFEVGSVAELGVTPILVERFTGGDLGAGVLGRAGAQASTAGCQPASSAPVALLGMATNEGEQSTVVLANPFAVEASGRLVGSSEFGLDMVTELESVRVPAHSTLTLPLGQLMAGRQQLGFTLYTDGGAIVAGMTRSGADIATSEAIAGAQQWFVPLPAFGVHGQLIVRNLASVEATYRIDALNHEGVIEGVDNGALPPDTEFWLQLRGPWGQAAAISSLPTSRSRSRSLTRARTPASFRLHLRLPTVAWLVPVSSNAPDSETAVWILNPEEAAVTAEVAVFGGATTEFEVSTGNDLWPDRPLQWPRRNDHRHRRGCGLPRSPERRRRRVDDSGSSARMSEFTLRLLVLVALAALVAVAVFWQRRMKRASPVLRFCVPISVPGSTSSPPLPADRVSTPARC